MTARARAARGLGLALVAVLLLTICSRVAPTLSAEAIAAGWTAGGFRSSVSAGRVDAASLQASSALTITGTAAAAGLTVSVSQTANLVNQAVDVSWKGAPATVGTPNFATDYLQIMQCWGNTSPDRNQCQFGADTAFDTRGGENAASRKVNQPSYLDPAEPLTKNLPAQTDAYVPFVPVACDGVKDCPSVVSGIQTLKNPYYDQSTTNEVAFAGTRGDGTGFESFEVQTYREAPGLGCGDIIPTGAKKGQVRNCWLVVVPRGDTEVDGTPGDQVLARGSHRLDTSPLSTTNWARRIVIPLKFAAAGQVCPIDAKQRPLGGVEPVAEAVQRWQPALCRNNGPVFSYTQMVDAVAGRKLAGSSPGLSFLTAGVTPSSVPPDRLYVYAPVAVSGISFAVMMERQTAADAAPADKVLDGQRITELNLTPRLVAKLLTQSYLLDVGPNARYLKANPSNITKDPDFLAVNPQFRKLDFRDSIETLVPIGLADSYATLWRWIAADQESADFVAGLPDPWGMRVNPFYQGTDIPRDSFPKIDPFCDGRTVPGAPPLCTLDRHPYAQDYHEAARSAARGDQLSRTNWDVNGNPPAWKKNALQLNGQRHILAVSDSATAGRFGLVTAKLRNAAGVFVAPTQQSLAAGLSAMRPEAGAGLLQADPQASSRNAYPLVTVSYAATAPNVLTKDQAKDYARFIRFAAVTGQKQGDGLGNLPDGYLPLTSALRQQALRVAKDVESRRGPVKSPDDTTSTPGGSSSGGGGSGVTGNRSASVAPTSPAPSVSPSVPPLAIAKVSQPTPPFGAVAARYVVLIALTLGICALILGLLLPRLVRRFGT